MFTEPQPQPKHGRGAIGARGFTLVEMIVVIVIIGVALVGVLSVLNITTRASADPIQPKQAMLVAESMIEEILLKPYNNPNGGYTPVACPDPTTCNRALFDNVADYNGYSSTGARSLDSVNTPIAGLESYNVAVAVNATPAAIQGSAGLSITVTVTAGGNAYSLTSYRFDYD